MKSLFGNPETISMVIFLDFTNLMVILTLSVMFRIKLKQRLGSVGWLLGQSQGGLGGKKKCYLQLNWFHIVDYLNIKYPGRRQIQDWHHCVQGRYPGVACRQVIELVGKAARQNNNDEFLKVFHSVIISKGGVIPDTHRPPARPLFSEERGWVAGRNFDNSKQTNNSRKL